MNSRRQMIKVGMVVLIVVLLGMVLSHCTNTTETKSVKSDKTVEKSKKKVDAKKPGKHKSTDIDKMPDQEEKKEETAKADSSNKSHTSESKKDNTATSSNKNNTSSSKPSNSSSNNSGTSNPSNNSDSNSESSKPAEHTHNWVAQYKIVNVPEKGHNEQVLVQDAYDEPTYGYEYHSFCNTCGLDLTANGINDAQHVKQHMLNGEGGSTTQKPVEVQIGTIHHEAVYETRYVVDSPATTKQELTGYKCSSCGKTRSN